MRGDGSDRRWAPRRAWLGLSLVLVTGIVTLGAMPGVAGAITRPDGLGITWGAPTARPAVPGPARVSPPAWRFPTFNGSGYSVYVCRAAREAGFSSGHLNNAFNFSTNVNDATPGNGHGARLTGFGAFPSVGAFTQQFQAVDSCNNWKSGAVGGMLVRRYGGRSFLFTDPQGSGAGFAHMTFDFSVGPPLAIQHVDYDADVTQYKTKGNAGGSSGSPPRNTDGDLWVVDAGTGIGVSRDRAPSSIVGDTSSVWDPRPTTADRFRNCSGIGRWQVGYPSFRPGYPAGEGWMDGDLKYRPNLPDGGYAGDESLGRIHTAPFYRTGSMYTTSPAWNAFMHFNSGSTHMNPGAICRMSGGPSGVTFRPELRPHQLYIAWSCGGLGNHGRYQGCRGTTGDSPERPLAASHSAHSFTYVRSVKVFVRDLGNPTVTLAPGGMNAGGAVIGSGNDNRTQEELRWTSSDPSGIRRVQVRLDGNIVQDTTLPCDHTYRVPCPGGTGTSPDMRPPMPAGGIPSLFRKDVDPLPRGLHGVQVSVQDGAGRWSTASGSFRIDTPLREEVCTDGGAAPIDGTSSVVTRTGVYGTDLVTAQPEVCEGRSFTDAVPGAPLDTAPVAGTLVGLPAPGAGIFSYTLAANQRPTSVPLNPGDCLVRDHVVTGAASPALSPRERNQIVSITIDLRSFVKQKSGSSGGQLGEHTLRSSFDLPTRATQRYRSALGCPS